METTACTNCGKPFDTKNHKLVFTHPNLFGGIDYLCKACVQKIEGNAKKSMKNMKRSGDKNE